MTIIQNSRCEMWMNNPISNNRGNFLMTAGSNCNCDIQCGCDDHCYHDGSNENSTLTCTGSASH